MHHIVSGNEAKSIISEKIKDEEAGLAGALACLKQDTTFFAWLDTIRAIEELINLPLLSTIDEVLEDQIAAFRLDRIRAPELIVLQDRLRPVLDAEAIERFIKLLFRLHAIGVAFVSHGVWTADTMPTVAHAIGYLQSRRRHLVAMLYYIPEACQGYKTIAHIDTLNHILPMVEFKGANLTGLYQKRMLSEVFSDFHLHLECGGFIGSHDLENLDETHLEPERIGVMERCDEVTESEVRDSFEMIDPRLIFSAAEARNQILLLGSAYEEFGLFATSFGQVVEFVKKCLATCIDEYHVRLNREQLEAFCNVACLPAAIRREIVHGSVGYIACTNATCPFIAIGDEIISTVTLLSRFLYYWKNKCLNRIRRFQIRSGFVFEVSVKKIILDQGFEVSDIRRINHKEFDVVAIKGDTIYNLQCKNNLIDLSRTESDPSLAARYHRKLDRYYSRALVKEEDREGLLKERLGLAKIKHFVISRFAVATENPRIIYFGRISEFRDRALSRDEIHLDSCRCWKSRRRTINEL